jgi:hypothetical protein
MADGTGHFALELPTLLSDIEHPIHARAIVGGSPQPESNKVGLTVDPGLLVDPVHILVTSRGITQHLRDGAGYANLGGRIWLRTGDVLDLSIPISCTNVISTDLYIAGLLATSLTNSQSDVWVGSAIPPSAGTFAITAKINCNGSVEPVALFEGLIDPDGYVYELSLGTDSRIAGAQVTCYELVDGSRAGWELWNGAIWGQQNPQTTAADGYYSFFTLPGTYKVRVTAPGYHQYESPELVVVDAPVHHNVGLEPWARVYLPLVVRSASD